MGLQAIDILYVEDNLADLKLLENKLKRASNSPDYQIFHTLSIKQANDLLLTQNVDLILLDLSLPDAHGLEGVTFFTQKYPNLPIIVFTGNTDSQMGVEAIKNGAQDYLVKGELSSDLFFKVCGYAVERKKINSQLNNALTKVENLNTNLEEVNHELTQTVEALQQEKKLVEEKNRQINSFINLLVHELKSPLSAIASMISLLLNEKGLSLIQEKYLSQIKHSSDSILDNILSIIEATQFNEGNIKLDLIAENPYYTLNAALDKFVIEAIQNDILIDVQYKKDLPIVSFDKRSLGNTISNLIQYSLKHHKKPSRINISTKIKDDYLQIEMDNRDMIMTEKEKKSLFKTSSSQLKGNSESDVATDFSLALTYEFVMAMHGKISVETGTEGRNIRYCLSLQIAD